MSVNDERPDLETTAPLTKPAGDMKMLRNLRESRPMLSIVQYNGTVYGSRGTEYGADKYARGNYFGPPPANIDPVDRFAEYIDAAMRHLGKIAQAINVAKGTGGDARAACAVTDEEASGGFPASHLPHIAHAIAGLKIAVECGITDGLLPLDPGQPWKQDPMYADVLARRAAGQPSSTHYGKSDSEIRAEQGGREIPAALAQKDDPDSERRRVADAANARRREQFEREAAENARLRAEGRSRPGLVENTVAVHEVEELDREIADGFGKKVTP